MIERFDYIVVGAGSAGCVLADRLSRDWAHRVLLIEAGGPDNSLMIQMPKGIGRLMGDPKHNHFYPTEPEPGNGQVGETWIRGKALGGSSSINGMVYNRGQPEDYDRLEQLGCEGWNWASVLDQFRKMEDHPLGASEMRGAGGPLRLSLPQPGGALNQAALQAAKGLGLQQLEDINGRHGEGATGLMPQTIRSGRRSSSSGAFLHSAMARPNLSVVTGKRVDRVVFEADRAVSVLCEDGSSYAVGGEVVLAAGALELPAILMRSGIGDGARLQALGIPVVRNTPAVGRNLMEHRVLFAQFRVKSHAYSQNADYRGARLFLNTARYMLTRSGLMAQGSFEVGAFIRATPQSDRPDGQILLTPYAIDTAKQPLTVERDPSITLFGFVLRPDSRGELTLRSGKPSDPPIIRPNYLATAHDQEIALGIFKFIRRWVSQPPLSDLILRETVPGPEFHTDEQMLQAWRTHAGCGYHTIGTCIMGGDDRSVVDPRLRVRGVEGLRVMDASILPHMVSGNTNAPMMAMAGRAAELLLQDAVSNRRAA